jgi:uncharacterized damage-inducible protein DinB
MYLSIEEFKQDWKNESELTHKLFSALTDDSLNQKVWAEGRSLGKIAWHIALCIGEMMNRAGLNIEYPGENAETPKSAAEILRVYDDSSKQLLEKINQWDEAKLKDEIDMYGMGEPWSYATILQILVRHEIHHRAQMTILMRQAGIKIPGVYGPSKEEWSAYGAPSQD